MADIAINIDAPHKDEVSCSVLSPPESDTLKDGSDSELSELDDVEDMVLPKPVAVKKESHSKAETPIKEKAHFKDKPQMAEKASISTPTVPTAPPTPEKEENTSSIATPAYYDGTVPVFRPDMEHFEDFTSYMNSVNSYGMQSGIIKIIPPPEWKDALPRYDELIKPIKVKDAIRQEILGTTGRFRQLNHVSQRSYNIPQWKALCEQSDHQPPAKRGERRANQRSNKAQPAHTTTTTTTKSTARPAKKAGRRQAKKNAGDDNDERLPTPGDSDDDEKAAAKTSVSARRKFNRKEAATRIDHEAFKDFDYELHEEFSRERCDELERAYWKTLTYASPLYGADHVGTLFDERTKIWNLDKLPNMLDVLGEKIPGVNTAYLYMGMWKATFAWHLEDVDLYSINYLHFGAPKQWYSISQKDARKFEGAMASHWPDDAKACNQFLRHKTFLISPNTLLEKHGIKVNKITHHPGEFIVTYPYGYHSGYNLGYNCAEAVNFALDSWLPYGRIAKVCDCSEAQDSVFIDVAHLERRLNGQPTPDPSEDEFSDATEDEDGPVEVLTPPESGGEIKIRIKNSNPKRKRATKSNTTSHTIKKIRINMPRSDSCVLCPHHIPHEKLIKTANGKSVHRKCAELIPEVTIEIDDGKEVVMGIEDIPKARADLKCVYCSQRKGACFQCTFGKCSRSYHGVCAKPAGVHIDEGEIPVYGDDGTEYKTFVQEPRCRFHREKRDKKVTMEDLENDSSIRKAALNVVAGDTVQFQFMNENYMAGLVVENDKSQACMTLDILPYADHRIILDYKWLRFPAASDCRLAKPSAKAIPLPKKSLNTSKRMANDLPRKGDEFVDGFKWEEFSVLTDFVHNEAQAKVDLSKLNQLWHYLGKKSTEAKPQYTEDPNKRIHNPLSNYMDTIPKPAHPVVPRSALSKPHAPKSNHGTNTLSAKSRLAPSVDALNKQRDRPYNYTPRIEAASHPNSYAIDQQAYKNQQQFLHSSQNSSQRAPLTFGSDPMKYNQTNAGHEAGNRPASAGRPPLEAQTPKQTMGQPSHRNPPQTIFDKYPYLRKQHNKSPLDYKSPYRQGGGFLNGYEGNLQEHLKRNPSALMSTYGSASKSEYAPILPPISRMHARPDQQYSQQARKPSYPEQWGKKTTTDLHPAIRPHFHSAYPSAGEHSHATNSQPPSAQNPSYVPSPAYPGASTYRPAPTTQTNAPNHTGRPGNEYPSILPPQHQTREPVAPMYESKQAAYPPPAQQWSRQSGYPSASSYSSTSSAPIYPHSTYTPPTSATSLSAYATSSAKPTYPSHASQQRTYDQRQPSSYSASTSYTQPQAQSQYASYESQRLPPPSSTHGHRSNEPPYPLQEPLHPTNSKQQQYQAKPSTMYSQPSQNHEIQNGTPPYVRTPDSRFVDLNCPNSMDVVQQIMMNLKKAAGQPQDSTRPAM